MIPAASTTAASAPPAFCIADKYTNREILEDPAKAKAFEDEYLAGESKYFDVVHDPKTGLIYDGVNLDPKTGEVQAVRNWSAPSKECLDLGVLVKALEGDPKAAIVVGHGDPAAAKAKAEELLGKKIGAYNDFQANNPGYAGFLPWYGIEDGKATAKPDWKNKIPGLDNGEWMWTMLDAEQALRNAGSTELADKYGKYNQMLQDNVTKVFYDPQGHACRGDVQILDPGNPDTGYAPVNPGSYMTGEHGVHEGSMLIHYLTLFGKGLPEGAADKIWGNIHMKRVENPHGTTWQGFWGSAHESWAYTFMPLRDDKDYANLFRIREEVRSQNAAERGYPGFATSVNGPKGDYLSAAGIEGIGSQPVTAQNTFTPYGSFPMLQEFSDKTGPNYGLAWLHNMLEAPRMEGPVGSGESEDNNGDAFAAMKTTDGTLPIWLAMMGGLEKETAQVMKDKGVYDTFMNRIDSKYQETFGSAPLREPEGFAAPGVEVPHQLLGDYLVTK